MVSDAFFNSGTVLYVVLLLVLLLISHKVLKLFIQVVVLSLVSAVLYVLMHYIAFPNLELGATQILFFSFFGPSVYLVYSGIFYIASKVKALFSGTKNFISSKISFRRFGSRRPAREKEVILRESRKVEE
jgi:hypothetical protein